MYVCINFSINLSNVDNYTSHDCDVMLLHK